MEDVEGGTHDSVTADHATNDISLTLDPADAAMYTIGAVALERRRQRCARIPVLLANSVAPALIVPGRVLGVTARLAFRGLSRKG